jgi:HEAT repeat protein
MARRLVVALLLVAAPVVFGSLAVAGDDPAGTPPKRDAGKADDPIAVLLGKLKEDQEYETRMEGLKEAKTVDDLKMIPALGKLLKAPEKAVRIAAIEDLGARASVETRKKAATVLCERLKPLDALLDKDPSQKDEVIAVAHALHDLAQPSSIEALLSGIDANSDLDVVEARAMAVGNIPDAKAIEGLIDYMSRGRRGGGGHGGRLSKALRYATGATVADDPDAWRAWWKVAKTHFDFEEAASKREKARAEQSAKEEARKGKGNKDGGKGKKEKPGTGDPGMGGDSGMGGDAGMGDGAPGDPPKDPPADPPKDPEPK